MFSQRVGLCSPGGTATPRRSANVYFTLAFWTSVYILSSYTEQRRRSGSSANRAVYHDAGRVFKRGAGSFRQVRISEAAAGRVTPVDPAPQSFLFAFCFDERICPGAFQLCNLSILFSSRGFDTLFASVAKMAQLLFAACKLRFLYLEPRRIYPRTGGFYLFQLLFRPVDRPVDRARASPER